MTKIFEALENAGLERYNLGNQQAVAVPIDRVTDYELEGVRARPIDTAEFKVEKMVSNLYQHIVRLLPEQQGRIVQFQATQVAEGTSTLARELAKAAAFTFHKSVLLLDLNQTKPNQCDYFGVHSELRREDASFESAPEKARFARVKNTQLYVTQMSTNGTSANNICELPETESFLEKLRDQFDLILIDSPSAISCSECLLLAPNVDGVVLVVKAGKTRWQTVDKVKNRIIAQNGRILGVVLNKRSYPIPNFIYKRI
jgi:Mrp family chromosome partitioning ATPase